MCGIIGVISASSNYQLQKRQYIEQALFAGTLRGRDGTGLFSVALPLYGQHSAAPTASWARQAAAASVFLKEDVAKGVTAKIGDAFAVIGHNRSATVGGASTENTHPFISGPITLVHNGTIYNQEALTTTAATVDSHAIAHALAENSVDDVIPTIEGAFALCWYDQRDGYLNIIRNSQRPLHFGISRYGDVVYIASEVDMLRWVASRNSIEISRYIQPTSGTLLRWRYDARSVVPEVRKLTISAVVRTNRVVHGNSYGNYGAYGALYADYDDDCTTQRASTPAVSGQPKATVTVIPALAAPAHTSKQTAFLAYAQPVTKVPAAMQVVLEDEALTINDRMLFRPVLVDKLMQRGRKIAKLSGTVGDAHVSACIYNLDSRVLGLEKVHEGESVDNRNLFWEVAPIGIRKNGTDTEVICRLVATGVDPAEFDPEYEMLDDAYFLYEGLDAADAIAEFGTPEPSDVQMGGPMSSSSSVDGLAAGLVRAVGGAPELLYPGLYNTLVSKKRFLELTKDGCYDCGSPIILSEASKMRWTLTGSKYVCICGGCQEMYNAYTNANMSVQ